MYYKNGTKLQKGIFDRSAINNLYLKDRLRVRAVLIAYKCSLLNIKAGIKCAEIDRQDALAWLKLRGIL